MLILVLYTSGCGSSVKRLKNQLNQMIQQLDAIPEKDGELSDYKRFYETTEQLTALCANSDFAIDRLKDLLMTGDRVASRAAAAETIGFVGRRKDALVLIHTLQDRSLFVRERTQRALERLTRENFGNNYDAWLNWWKKENTPHDTQ